MSQFDIIVRATALAYGILGIVTWVGVIAYHGARNDRPMIAPASWIVLFLSLGAWPVMIYWTLEQRLKR